MSNGRGRVNKLGQHLNGFSGPIHWSGLDETMVVQDKRCSTVVGAGLTGARTVVGAGITRARTVVGASITRPIKVKPADIT
jgi:hypothetical protein